MKRFIILLCLLSAPAWADDRSTCLMAAAAHLPAVPGLQIVSSQAQELTIRPQDKKTIRSQFIVTIDFTAAARTMQSQSLCTLAAWGVQRPFIEPWPRS